MWATEVFFQCGGEPHFMFPTTSTFQSQAAQQPSPQLATYGTPGSTYGTPGSSYASPSVLGRAIMGPELVMSGRHQGFCLNLARLIRYDSLSLYICYYILYLVPFGMLLWL